MKLIKKNQNLKLFIDILILLPIYSNIVNSKYINRIIYYLFFFFPYLTNNYYLFIYGLYIYYINNNLKKVIFRGLV